MLLAEFQSVGIVKVPAPVAVMMCRQSRVRKQGARGRSHLLWIAEAGQ